MRLALLLASLPALALAQTTTGSGLSIQIQGQSSQTVSGSQCGSTVRLTWTANVGGIPCSDLLIWASSASCGDAPDGGDFQIQDVPTATWSSQGTGTADVLVSDLPLDVDGGTCGGAFEQTINLCASLNIASPLAIDCAQGKTPVRANPNAAIDYDALPPDVPTINAVDPLDGALRVAVNFPSDATRVTVQYRAAGETAWTTAGDASPEAPSVTIDGLTDGTTYEVQAFAVDAAGNQSGVSDIKTGQPIATVGFWGAYHQDQGAETGGCNATGASGLFAGILVLIGLLWRKR